ncbi:hypothetical protein [Butyrivibrio sp. JL13D10]|uniref:hypothetical protein n=1 Tax=Butyrivibrio sp. JL13D10 TaxID=3236815 RepID=UPI0038B54672
MEKVEQLEKELAALKLKVTDLETGLKNAELRISRMETSHAPETAAQNPAPTSAFIPAANAASNRIMQQAEAPYQNVQHAEASYRNAQQPEAPYRNIQQTKVSYQNAQRPSAPRPNINTESWIGKILMGALASLLVFIALITFARLLMPFITDTIKIILMFAGSIALTATGFVLSKNKPENTFFKALLACGSACIYLSILVTGIHFKAISSLVMYILLAVWAILLFFLKENKNDWLFFSIGNLGYLVSIMFTIGLEDSSLIIPMLIYVVIISASYLVMYWKNARQRAVQSILGIASLVLFQMIVTFNFGKIAEVLIVGVVAVFCSFAGFLAYIVADIMNYKKSNLYLSAVNTGAYLLSYFILHLFIHFPVLFSFAVILIPAIVFIVLTAYRKYNNVNETECVANAIFSGILFILAAMIVSINEEFIFTSGIVMIAYSAIAIYGFIKKDDFFKITGWFLVSICMVLGYEIDAGLLFASIAALLSLSALVVEGYLFNTSQIFKIMSYLTFLVSVIVVGRLISDLPDFISNYEIINFSTFGAIALINLALSLTGFYKTKDKDNGKSLHTLMNVVNLLLMLSGSGAMRTIDSAALKVFYMLIIFILACVNLPINGKGSRGKYLYTGIKFGALIFHSLWVFDTPNFIISIIMITFAVICIAIGFKIRNFAKDLRIFGLLTTLTFVFKFIVIDIDFDNSVLKALSYLIAGILCFGISAIYNHFEKAATGQPMQQLQSPEQ